jgi:outer membrane biosynthesis protein TonB
VRVVVRLRVLVGTEGTVRGAEAIDGPMVLRDSARRTAGRWIFKPAMSRGKPVAAWTEITIAFEQ